MADRKTQGAQTQEIERRAYELYLERGGGDGHDLDDWIQAERELGRHTEKSQLGSQLDRNLNRGGLWSVAASGRVNAPAANAAPTEAVGAIR